MDARELTAKYIELSNKVNIQAHEIEYLNQECEKMRVILDDLKVDIKMLQSERR